MPVQRAASAVRAAPAASSRPARAKTSLLCSPSRGARPATQPSGPIHHGGPAYAASPATVPNAEEAASQIRGGARQLALTAMIDLSVFFAVLLVGFAYVWYRGDLDWVRAIGRRSPTEGWRSPAGVSVSISHEQGDH